MLGHRNNVTLPELLRMKLRGSTENLAKSRIEHIEESDAYKLVYFKGIGRPLYFPKQIGTDWLYVVIDECMSPDSWHNYELSGKRVEVDDVVLDCGAGEGLFSLMVLDRCRRVYAAEPLPIFAASLRCTFEGESRVTLLQYALSRDNGWSYFESNGLGSRITLGEQDMRVETRTIDSLFFDAGIEVNFIKADVEGHELELLEGGIRTIEKWKPKIAITTYHSSNHAAWITGFLKKIDERYKVYPRGIVSKSGTPVMLHAWRE